MSQVMVDTFFKLGDQLQLEENTSSRWPGPAGPYSKNCRRATNANPRRLEPRGEIAFSEDRARCQLCG